MSEDLYALKKPKQDRISFNLSNEQIILRNAHTLHIVKHDEQYLGYVGFWLWEGMKLLVGSKPTNLEFYSKDFIISPARWPTAIRAFNKTHLFCGQKLEGLKIVKYESVDGKPPFKRIGTITHGRNPFIWQDPNTQRFYLYFQRQRGNIKAIYVSSIDDLETLLNEKCLLEMAWTLGAPSMAYFKNAYWLTVETRHKLRGRKGNWFTPLYRGKSPVGPFQQVGVLVDAPCVFQHIFDGEYLITYSKRRADWDVRIKWGELERLQSV